MNAGFLATAVFGKALDIALLWGDVNNMFRSIETSGEVLER